MEPQKINYKDIIKKEYAKCAADPAYFLMKYVFIQSTEKGRTLFIPHEYQKKLLSLIIKYDRTLILKSRQLGITTLCAGFSLWLMIFQNDSSILCMAPDKNKAQEIIQKIRFAYDELPSWLKNDAQIVASNTTMLRLTNGSVAQAVSGSPKSARSKTAKVVIIDEAAFLEKDEEMWAAAQQTVATGGKIIMLSTPNGTENLFCRKWEEAELGENDFVPIRLPWNVHPSRDQAWRDKQDRELGVRLAAQECDCSFVTSGNTYIEPEHLEYYKERLEEPIEMTGPQKEYWKWKYPHEVGACMVIVDTSKGGDGDRSGIQVIEIETGDQVAEFQGQVEPDRLAQIAVGIATDYHNALLIIENTGLGIATVSHAEETGYKNIYYHPKGDTSDSRKYFEKWTSQTEEDMDKGFPTSTKTRPLVILAFRQYIIDHAIKIRSKRLHSEMKAFIFKDGKPQAKSGYHDDLLLPYAIGLYLRDTAIEHQLNGIELQKSILKSIKKTNPYSLGYTKSTPSNVRNPYDFKVGDQVEDISYLAK